MSALIVVESAFGNTRRIADAIAAGLGPSTRVISAANAPAEIPADIDLLLVGAPTHAFSLPTEASRQQAARQGATDVQTSGIAEWIARVQPRIGLRAVAFDTVVRTPRLITALGTAARRAAKQLRQRGFDTVEEGMSFRVEGKRPVLASGELQRARDYGIALAV